MILMHGVMVILLIRGDGDLGAGVSRRGDGDLGAWCECGWRQWCSIV
jgi:hypothetical protein